MRLRDGRCLHMQLPGSRQRREKRGKTESRQQSDQKKPDFDRMSEHQIAPEQRYRWKNFVCCLFRIILISSPVCTVRSRLVRSTSPSGGGVTVRAAAPSASGIGVGIVSFRIKRFNCHSTQHYDKSRFWASWTSLSRIALKRRRCSSTPGQD